MKKLICLMLAAIMICALAACTSGYNAEIYDRATDWVKEEYILDNFDATYYGGHWKGDFTTKTLAVTSQEEFDEIFDTFPIEIDYDKEILVLYFFTETSNSYDCTITEIKNSNNELIITLKHKKNNRIGHTGASDASLPIFRCVAIKMKKIESDNLKVDFACERNY